MRTRICLTSIVLALTVAGCGGGEPAELNGLTQMQPSLAARDAMDDEVIDPKSPAHGRTWLIDETHAEQLPDGRWAWRVTFFAIEKRTQTLCMWLHLTSQTIVRQDVEYYVDRCPPPATS